MCCVSGCHSQEKNNKRSNFSHTTHDELFLYLIIIVKKEIYGLVIADIFSAWSPRGAKGRVDWKPGREGGG